MSKEHFIADDFLATDPDCPVFGLNLACAYPFLASVEKSYNAMAASLAALDESAYVYPFWETHVTIMTFVSFRLNRRPSPARQEELQSLATPIANLIRHILEVEVVEPFQLEFPQPELSPKAAILPIVNPTGEIARIRRRASQLLEANKPLHEKLSAEGLNIPGIIHSTIMRWTKTPRDPARVAASFAAVATRIEPFSFTVSELLLSAETKPYMRGGGILHRFPLTK